MVDAVLELIVRSVLAGVQIVVIFRWVIGRVAAVLEFVLELCMFILHASS